MSAPTDKDFAKAYAVLFGDAPVDLDYGHDESGPWLICPRVLAAAFAEVRAETLAQLRQDKLDAWKRAGDIA